MSRGQHRAAQMGALSQLLRVGPGLGPETWARRGLTEVVNWGEEEVNSRTWLLPNTCFSGEL